MVGPRTKSGRSIGFDSLLLSFLTIRMLLFTVSLCLVPPGQDSGISKILKILIGLVTWRPLTGALL